MTVSLEEPQNASGLRITSLEVPEAHAVYRTPSRPIVRTSTNSTSSRSATRPSNGMLSVTPATQKTRLNLGFMTQPMQNKYTQKRLTTDDVFVLNKDLR